MTRGATRGADYPFTEDDLAAQRAAVARILSRALHRTARDLTRAWAQRRKFYEMNSVPAALREAWEETVKGARKA